MAKFDKAWVLGRWPEDDPIADVWKNVASAHGVAFERSTNIARVIPKLTADSVVLLRYGLDIVDKPFKALLASRARLILYLPEGGRTVAPRESVALCKKNVLTILLQRDGQPQSFSRRLDRLYAGRSMYKEIRVSALDGKPRPDVCFLISPFSKPGEEFLEAATAGLEGRGLQIKDPREIQFAGTLAEKIKKFIHEVDFILADTRIPQEGANKNVWLEIGIAIAKDKPAVLSTHADDEPTDAIASDLHGVEYLKYWNGLDLTMKLYWGFRWVDGAE